MSDATLASPRTHSPLARLRHPAAAALAVALMAFGLRVYRLADRNIWWDEGWTIWLGQQSLVSIALRTASDEHPPLHYWLMHAWMSLAGREAFAGRMFSVLMGTLMVAVMYRLGRRAGGPWLGVVGGLLLALARFHIWWSQDIKNYTLAGFFALASAIFTLRLLAPEAGAPRRRPWLAAGYVAASALALYTHYLAGLFFLANNLCFLLVILARWRKSRPVRGTLLRWSLAQTAVLALFAPWAWLYLSRATAWAAAAPIDFGFFLRLSATVFTMGTTIHIERYLWPTAWMSALAGAGALWLLPAGRGGARRPAPGALLALLVILVPPLMVYTLSLTPMAFFAPKVQPRYLLIFLPGYLLLVALGLWRLMRLSRPLASAALATTLLAQVWALPPYYQERRLHDDYFTLARTISAFAQPGDGILLHTDQEWPTFLYYLQRPIPWDGVLSKEPVGPVMAEGRAEQMTRQFQAVWLVKIPDALARDPQRLVEASLGRRLPLQFERAYGDKLLLLYAAAPRSLELVPPESFRPQQSMSVELGSGLRLIGFDLPVREARGGDSLRAVTYWQANGAQSVTLELRDAAGQVIQAHTASPSAGGPARVQSDLALPPEAAGEYTLVASALSAGGGRLEQQLAEIDVHRPPPARRAGPIPATPRYRLGDGIRLVGYRVSSAEARPGSRLGVDLYWESIQPVQTSYKVFVHLVGEEFNPATGNPLWGQADEIPSDGLLPTNAWTPGEIILDSYQVELSPDAPPGEYWVTVGLYDPVSGERLPIYDRLENLVGNEVLIGALDVRAAP